MKQIKHWSLLYKKEFIPAWKARQHLKMFFETRQIDHTLNLLECNILSRYYNNSGLYTTIIYPKVNPIEEVQKIFIAVEDNWDVFKITNDGTERLKILFNFDELGNEFKNSVNSYCGLTGMDKSESRVYLSRFICSFEHDVGLEYSKIYFDNKVKNKRPVVVHHDDENPENNYISNLIPLLREDHDQYHSLKVRSREYLDFFYNRYKEMLEAIEGFSDDNEIKTKKYRTLKTDDTTLKRILELHYLKGIKPEMMKRYHIVESVSTIRQYIKQYPLFKKFYSIYFRHFNHTTNNQSICA